MNQFTLSAAKCLDEVGAEEPSGHPLGIQPVPLVEIVGIGPGILVHPAGHDAVEVPQRRIIALHVVAHGGDDRIARQDALGRPVLFAAIGGDVDDAEQAAGLVHSHGLAGGERLDRGGESLFRYSNTCTSPCSTITSVWPRLRGIHAELRPEVDHLGLSGFNAEAFGRGPDLRGDSARRTRRCSGSMNSASAGPTRCQHHARVDARPGSCRISA